MKYQRLVLARIAVLILVTMVVSGCLNPLDSAAVLQAGDVIEPTLSVITPLDGSVFGQQVTLQGTVSDPGGQIRRVWYTVSSTGAPSPEQDVVLDSNGEFSATFSTAAYASELVVTVYAQDWNGNVADQSLRLRYSGSDIPSFSVEPDAGSVSVSFEAVEGADSYTVWFTRNGVAPTETNAESVVLTRAYSASEPFVIPGLENGRLHAFTLSAESSTSGRTWESGVVNAIPLSPLTLAPQIEVTDRSARLSWVAVPAASSYEVFRGFSPDGPWVNVSGPVFGTEYEDTGAPRGTNLWYHVVAAEDSRTQSASVPTRLRDSAPLDSRLTARLNNLAGIDGLATGGNYAYLFKSAETGDPGRLITLDISDQYAPVVLSDRTFEGALGFDDPLVSVRPNTELYNNHLYVSRQGEILVFDVTVPTNPQLVNILDEDLPDQFPIGDIYAVVGMVAMNDYLYVLFSSHGLRVFDISDPASTGPPLARSPAGIEDASSSTATNGLVESAGDLFALVRPDSSTKLLLRYDLSVDQTNPAVTQVQNFDTLEAGGDGSGNPYGIVASDSYVYVADFNNSDAEDLLIFQASDGSFLGSYAGITLARELILSDRYLLVANGVSLTALDLDAGGDNPLPSGSVEVQTSDVLAVEGDTALVAGFSAGLQFVNVAPPKALDFTSSVVNAVSRPVDLSVAGDLVVTTNGASNEPILQIHQLSGTTLSPIGASAQVGTGDLLLTRGPYAFVSGRSASNEIMIWLFDFSDPAAPELLAQRQLPSTIRALALYGDLVYFSIDGGGVQIADSGTLETFENVGFEPTSNTIRDLSVRDNYLLAASSPNQQQVGVYGLSVYDLTNPVEPDRVGTAEDAEYSLRSMVVAGEYVYAISAPDRGLEIFDIQDVEVPTWKTRVTSPEEGTGSNLFPIPHAVSVFGDYLAYADWNEETSPGHTAGIWLYRATAVPDFPAEPTFFERYGDYADNEYGVQLTSRNLFIWGLTYGVEVVPWAD
jgi:hypothetical protein